MRDTQKDLYRKNLGADGERRALKFLKRKGYRLIEKNYRTPFGEADLIMEDGDEIVFVEVKTRSSRLYGTPAEAVDARKRETYRRIALFYLQGEELSCRFDVVEVENGEINHIENAF